MKGIAEALTRGFRPRIALGALVAAGLILFASACGGGGSTTSGGTTSGGSTSSSGSSEAGGATAASNQSGGMESLTIAVPTVDPVLADIFVAKTQGFYEKAGVDVTLKNLASAALDGVVAGQADLAQFGTGEAFIPVVQGKDTSIVYNTLGAGLSASVGVAKDSDYKSLLDLSGKRVGQIGTASSSEAYINAYNKYLESEGKEPMVVVPQDSTSGEVQSLAGGGLDAVVGGASYFASAAVKPKVRLIVDTSTPAGEKFLTEQVGVGDFAEDALFGMKENLEEKRSAVTKALQGLREADVWMKHQSPTVIAEALAEWPEFSAYGSVEAIAEAVKFNKPFYAPTLGMITPERWQTTLKWLDQWKIPGVTISDPQWGYDERVDMSYLEAAAPPSE